MSDNRSKLIAWIQSGMDYNSGINLLVEFSGKSFFRSFFTGKEKTLPRKLSYEICKASGVAGLGKWEDFILNTRQGNAPLTVIASPSRRQENVQPPQKVIQVPKTTISEEEEIIGTMPLHSYPPVIRRIVHEYASLFQERSKLHTVMVEMPESNAETVVSKRAELFDMIKSLSDRITVLYEAKKSFDEKKIIPVETDIFPEEIEETEEELTILDEKALKARKKNLQNSNSRDQSMLDYQSVSHGKEKKPMPAGPKRIKLESRMEVRTKKIEAVDMALLKYVSKV